jgi:hypothetical protein
MPYLPRLHWTLELETCRTAREADRFVRWRAARTLQVPPTVSCLVFAYHMAILVDHDPPSPNGDVWPGFLKFERNCHKYLGDLVQQLSLPDNPPGNSHYDDHHALHTCNHFGILSPDWHKHQALGLACKASSCCACNMQGYDGCKHCMWSSDYPSTTSPRRRHL